MKLGFLEYLLKMQFNIFKNIYVQRTRETCETISLYKKKLVKLVRPQVLSSSNNLIKNQTIKEKIP